MFPLNGGWMRQVLQICIRIQHGLSVLLFDGVDDKIATASVVSTATTTFEMFIVTKALATTPERVVFHNGNNTTGYGYTQSDYYTSKQGFLIGGVTWVQSVDDVDTTNFHIYLLRRLSGTMTLYRNGTSIATSTSVPLAATTRTILGDYTNGTKPTSCYIAEATLHEGLSTLAVNQMGNYYATKWGLSWSAI